MAMTKKEREAMQAAIDRAETLAALRWTAPVLPDVPPPDSGGYSRGWTFNQHPHYMTVEVGWSTSVSHGRGEPPERGEYRSGSQGRRWLYSTRDLAIAAMRHEVEKEAAAKLLKIDRMLKTEA